MRSSDTRSLQWWYLDEGRRFAMQAELPRPTGAVVAKAWSGSRARSRRCRGGGRGVRGRTAGGCARRAVQRAGGERPDPDRATVVVHAQLEGFARGTGAELEEGPAIHPSTVERLMCTSRVQTVVEDRDGTVVRLGRDVAARAGVDAPSGPVPGPWVHVPGVRREAVHRGAPRAMVARRRPDDAREPRADLFVPSPPGARARLAPRPRARDGEPRRGAAPTERACEAGPPARAPAELERTA